MMTVMRTTPQPPPAELLQLRQQQLILVLLHITTDAADNIERFSQMD